MATPIPVEGTRAGRTRRARWGWALAGVLCVAFAGMAIEFTLAVRADRPGAWAALQALLTDEAYSLGAGSAHEMYPTYRKALAAMTSHTMLGGLALGLAVLQFVPGLRRRHPRVHRAIGAGVIAAVTLSMLGAIGYLARTPLADTYASPAFGLGLWVLAFACLGYLAAAIVAVRRRDFRSHMGFMALMLSTLLTAPVLRFEWALFGAFTPHDMATVNQGVSTFLALTTILLITLWMHHVGTFDLPARRRQPVLPPRMLTLLAWTAVVAVTHEALIAPAGYDLLAVWRLPQERWPALAALWAVPAVALALRIPREIARVVEGSAVTPASAVLAVCAGAGALVLSARTSRHSVDAVALGYFWAAYGLALCGLLAAGRGSRRADEPWTLMWLFLALTPGTFPVLFGLAWICAQGYTVGMWLGCTVGSAAMAAGAFLTAFAILPPGIVQSSASR
jgi:hypothetical protein